MLVSCRPANPTVTTSINKCWCQVDSSTSVNVYVNIQPANRQYSLQGRAWKMPSCICSCQLFIKSEVCYGDCWKLRHLLEAAMGCRQGPQYDRKCFFYFNYYFFCTTPTNQDIRQKAVHFPARLPDSLLTGKKKIYSLA